MIRITNHITRVEGYPVRYKVAQRGGEEFIASDDKQALILVHGLSGSLRWWVRNVSSLAEHYRVYLVNLPGFGTLRRSPTRFALDKAASWLLLWMQSIGLRKANLVGHSMGGYVCIQMAAHSPDLVDHLVLVAPAGIPTSNSLVGYLKPLLVGARYMSPSFLPILLSDALRAGPATLLRTAGELLSTDVRADLKLISAPTLLIWGENDTLVPASLGDILRQEIPNSRLLMLKKAGHVVMFDRPHEFNTAVLSFLASESVGM